MKETDEPSMSNQPDFSDCEIIPSNPHFSGARIRRLLVLGLFTLLCAGQTFGQAKPRMVRIAKIVVDQAQVDSYKAALKEEIEASIRLEPGVLTLYAVSEKDKPHHITILEIYADSSAYKSHIQTPHFLKYKAGTKEMVKSLELVDTVPLIPGMKIK